MTLVKLSYSLKKHYRDIVKKIKSKTINISNYFFELYFKKIIQKIIEEDNFLVLKDENEINEWGKYHSDYFKNAIALRNKLQLDENTKKELELIDWYCGHHSENINNYLRGKPIRYGISDKVINDIELLDNLINKFTIKENIIVVRRMPNCFLADNYKINNEFIEKGFLSTSLNINYRLNKESDSEQLNNETILILKIPKLLNAVYVENAIPGKTERDEFELILQRGCLMKVKYRKKIFNNNIILIEVSK